jgi:hypothetical protein
MKPSQTCLWGLVLAIGLCAGLGFYASVTAAHDGEGTGDFFIGDNRRGGTVEPGSGSGDSGDPGGLEADPDTFSVDSRQPTLRDVIRTDPWVSQGILYRSVGWVLRLAIAKFFAAW